MLLLKSEQNEACWSHVKENISASDSLVDKIDEFIIREEEYVLRNSEIDNNEDFNYFNHLHTLLKDNGKVLVDLHKYTRNNSEYVSEKSTVKIF